MHSSFMQLRKIPSHCNFLKCFPHGNIVKILKKTWSQFFFSKETWAKPIFSFTKDVDQADIWRKKWLMGDFNLKSTPWIGCF
jgi:hypothetical protein